jgi:tRNA threonylcarbamoyladenosine biosynthesis protein TsaB
MRLLALETSTEYCSVALWQDGRLIESSRLAGQQHSEMLLPMIDEILHQGGMKISQLEGIAFGAGPGSFTGVRMACGVAQGLALGANLPVLGICTLQALAQVAGHHKIIAALDARMGEIYHAAYEMRHGAWEIIHAPSVCLPQDAPLVTGDGWHGAGSGFAAHGAALQARYAGHLAAVNAEAVPLAGAVACLAAPLFTIGKGVDAAAAQPLYLRDKVALTTRERQARHTP